MTPNIYREGLNKATRGLMDQLMTDQLHRLVQYSVALSGMSKHQMTDIRRYLPDAVRGVETGITRFYQAFYAVRNGVPDQAVSPDEDAISAFIQWLSDPQRCRKFTEFCICYAANIEAALSYHQGSQDDVVNRSELLVNDTARHLLADAELQVLCHVAEHIEFSETHRRSYAQLIASVLADACGAAVSLMCFAERAQFAALVSTFSVMSAQNSEQSDPILVLTENPQFAAQCLRHSSILSLLGSWAEKHGMPAPRLATRFDLCQHRLSVHNTWCSS